MAEITRNDVVQRAELAFQYAGYFWGGDYKISNLHVKYVGDSSTYKNPYGNNSPYYPVVPDSTSKYIACDCSGFCGWAWALKSKHGSGAWSYSGRFAQNFRKRTSYNHNASDFAGIQAGDVLWRNGHVALYIGSNTVLELSTKYWYNSTNGHGGNRRTIAVSEKKYSYEGYCSFDNTYSSDYDNENDEPDKFIPNGGGTNSDLNGVNDGAIGNIDTSFFNPWHYIVNHQYTKRYDLMKLYRR